MYTKKELEKRMEVNLEFMHSLLDEIRYLTRDLQLHAEILSMDNAPLLINTNKKMLAKADRLTDAYKSLTQVQQYIKYLDNELYGKEFEKE